MNKKWLVALAAISSVALSNPALSMSRSGLYFGGGLGWGNTDYNIDRPILHHDLKEPGEDGFAARAYLGFQFNRYLGVESGFTAFSEVDFPNDVGSISTLQWDVLGKIGSPFGNTGFRGDLKFGAGQIFTDYNAGERAQSWGYHGGSDSVTRPIAGASLSYDFCSNVAMDVSYLHAFGDLHAKKGEFAPNTDLVTMGLSILLPI